MEALPARESAMFALADEAARTKWSTLPASMAERGGDLSDPQRRLLHDPLRASTSSQGYLKIAGVMWLDDILREQSGDRRLPRGLFESSRSDNYWFSFFGDLAADERWAWMLTGHHLAANFTFVADSVAFTPLFLGAEPYEIEEGPYAGWRVLSHEVERGFEVIQSLSEAQRQQAVLKEGIPRDVIEGPGCKASLQTFEGLPASDLDSDQRRLVWLLIQEYVRNADHDTGDAHLAKIEDDGPDNLYFRGSAPRITFGSATTIGCMARLS